jgi:hypothetical protein
MSGCVHSKFSSLTTVLLLPIKLGFTCCCLGAASESGVWVLCLFGLSFLPECQSFLYVVSLTIMEA